MAAVAGPPVVVPDRPLITPPAKRHAPGGPAAAAPAARIIGRGSGWDLAVQPLVRAAPGPVVGPRAPVALHPDRLRRTLPRLAPGAVEDDRQVDKGRRRLDDHEFHRLGRAVR